MILPIGLGDKYFKKPWLTILLILANVCVFLAPDMILPGSADFKIFKVFQSPAVKVAAEKSFVDDCRRNYSFSESNCRELFEDFTQLDTDQRLFYQLNSRQLMFINNFYQDRLKGLIPSWPAAARAELKEYYESRHHFSPVNRSWRSLIESEFQHGSLMHLLGNMLFLLLVGVWVEQRIPRLHYFLVYMLGGSLGFLLSSYIELGPLSPLIGASANVATLMGLFVYFFGNHRGKFQFWYLFPLPVMSTFYARMSSVLIPMYFLVDVAGAFNSLGQVAHAAHLGGWLVGLGCGFLIERKQKVPFPFIHPKERAWTQELAEIQDPKQQLVRARYLLERNRENRWARECLVRILVTQGFDPPLLRAELAPLLSVLVREGKVARAAQFLGALPTNMPVEHYVTKLAPRTCRRIFYEALKRGYVHAAERALLLYGLRSSRHEKLESQFASYLEAKREGRAIEEFVDQPGEDDAVPARFEQRFLALVIDAGLTAAAGSVLVGTLRPLALFLSDSYGQTFLSLIATPFINLAVLYWLVWKPTAALGQSFGKKAMHIRVIEIHAPGNPGVRWSTVLLREIVGKFLSLALLGIGYLMALRPDGLALHDRLVDTRVIQSEE